MLSEGRSAARLGLEAFLPMCMLKRHMYILESLFYLKKKEEREGVNWMSSAYTVRFSNQMICWSAADYNI